MSQYVVQMWLVVSCDPHSAPAGRVPLSLRDRRGNEAGRAEERTPVLEVGRQGLGFYSTHRDVS